MSMRYVKRHRINPERLRPMLVNTRADLEKRRLAPLPTMIGPIRRIGQLGEEAIELASVVDRDSEFLYPAARALAQGKTASVVLAAGVCGAPLEVPFYDRRLVFPGTGADALAHVGAWRDGYYGALFSRDVECLDLLETIPDEILRSSTARSDEFAYVWKQALIAFRAKPESALPVIERAVALTRPGKFECAHPLAAATAEAAFPLLGHLAEGDEAAFNEGLEKALAVHQRFWGAPGQRKEFYGFVAWGPLALACIAFDRGMRIEVESEYLLPYLLERRFSSAPKKADTAPPVAAS